MNRGFWRLQDGHAVVECGALEARLNVARPDLGLGEVKISGKPVAGAHLLCVESPSGAGWDAASIDVYERGADLVATLPASEPWPFRLQIYWRVWMGEFTAAIAAVEMIVSLQTALLDTNPRLFTSSRLPAADLYQLVDAGRGQFVRREATASPTDIAAACDCVLVRPPERSWTYGEMTHPTGSVESTVGADGGGAAASSDSSAPALRLRHQLFAERLEKGVILRARALAAFVDRSDERRSLASIYRAYAASDPPLTT